MCSGYYIRLSISPMAPTIGILFTTGVQTDSDLFKSVEQGPGRA